jgi:hypothetical protein
MSYEIRGEQFAERQVRRRFQQPADGEIQRARFQQLEEFGIEAHVKMHLRRGTFGDEAGQQRLADEARDDMTSPDPHAADLARGQLRDLAFRVIQCDARLVHARAESRADGRQLDATRRAAEQLRAHVRLEPLQAPRERRLAHTKHRGRPRQIARVAYREEILEFPGQQRYARWLSLCVDL